jgi:hypothetical protein
MLCDRDQSSTASRTYGIAYLNGPSPCVRGGRGGWKTAPRADMLAQRVKIWSKDAAPTELDIGCRYHHGITTGLVGRFTQPADSHSILSRIAFCEHHGSEEHVRTGRFKERAVQAGRSARPGA